MSHPRTGSPRRRRTKVAVAATIALVAGLLAAAPGAQAAPDTSHDKKIENALQSDFTKDRTQDYWIRFNDQADLSSASRVKGWDARGAAVWKALTSTAKKSQERVVADLDESSARYQSFAISNTIYVESGTRSLASTLADRPEVSSIEASDTVALEKPLDAKPEQQVESVEWGLADIRANDTWADFGVNGSGIVVGSIDSGVDYTHPALVGKYRGNLGNGNFDHNYNWWDPSLVCGDPSLEPCDNNDHGTHTMGTMVGDDGAGNQIGVAPGAKWMTAKGCEVSTCSELALTSSAQFMLAPTDLNGDNADPSKRPNIINNSWGGGPADDWYEPFVDAWIAAGQFPSWSNGNDGPACDTAGAPGEYPQSYAAGNHDINGLVAPTSSRGPGVDGDIKPNISAPGTAVRSSIPGDGYAAFTGTSMAAPHVSGSVALLWEAAPSLVGDIDATRALLDGAAVDTEDLQCGGTAADNNVNGEGFLDVYSAVEAAPRGDAGVLKGTVSDATDDSPVAGADVTVTGPADRSTTTEDNGDYRFNLLAGTYDLDVSAFGYLPAQVSGVDVAAGSETVEDVALEPAPSVTVSGTVADGSGHGWPLYAEVTVDDTPMSTYTDPVTGDYSFTLPSGSSYDVTVTPTYDGYVPATETVDLTGSDNVTQDFAVTVDASNCLAPGYTVDYDGLLENFDDADVPAGWAVEDNVGNGQVWQFDDPGDRGNLTGGDGGFATIDSDAYGGGNSQDTSLVSPVFNLTGVDTPVLEFANDYNDIGDEQADVDLSLDGGATWDTVWHQTTDLRGPGTIRVPVPDAAGQSDVQLRFHYYVGTYDWWWQVDDVFVGNRRCVPVDGGLVVGNVTEASEGSALNGAKVTSDDAPEDTATTGATPDDEAVGDGFYSMFSSLSGQHPFTASKSGYESRTKQVPVAADSVVRADFVLGAGHLVVSPTSVSTLVTLGGSQEKTFDITNDGTGAADVEIGESDGGFEILTADGGSTTQKETETAKGSPLQRIKAPVTPLQSPEGKGSVHGRPELAQTPHDAPWVDVADYPSNIMDNSVAYNDGLVYSFGGTTAGTGATDAAYVYDPAALAWSPIASMPEGRQMPAASFINGKYYAVGGWGESGNPVAETAIYDPATDSWSQGADNPTPWAAAGTAVLDGKLYAVGGCGDACGESDVVRYDPASDSFETLADYPEATSWVACGGVDGQVVCAGGNGGSAGSDKAYAYDPGTNTWNAVADLPVDVWAASYTAANDQLLISGGVAGGAITNAGYAYNADGTWTALPNSNNAVYRGGASCGMYKVGGSTGNFSSTPLAEMLPGYDQCGGGGDVSWLSADPTTATIAPGETVQFTVTTDASQVGQPGTYAAQLTIKENTPYPSTSVDVTMNVAPPKSWGKLAGTVSGIGCDGASGPLAGAIVQVDGRESSWSLFTGSDGTYARWLPAENKLQMIAAKDGHVPQTRKENVKRGKTTVADFDLRSSKC